VTRIDDRHQRRLDHRDVERLAANDLLFRPCPGPEGGLDLVTVWRSNAGIIFSIAALMPPGAINVTSSAYPSDGPPSVRATTMNASADLVNLVFMAANVTRPDPKPQIPNPESRKVVVGRWLTSDPKLPEMMIGVAIAPYHPFASRQRAERRMRRERSGM
jgi:hypothetical protein